MENLISFMYDLSDSLKLSSDTLFEVVNVHAAVEMTQETDEDERWMTEEDNIPLSKLMQGEDEDDIPLSHFRQNKNEDDFPLSQFRQSEDKDNIPLSHLQRGTESSFVESCLHMDDIWTTFHMRHLIKVCLLSVLNQSFCLTIKVMEMSMFHQRQK